MSDISLSKAVRSNLLSLKGTADMMATTQNRLATGNKVNSALDNPSNWFTAQGLNNRASDLNALIDSMANGVQTLEAADNGLTAMTKTLESMQSTLRQARQDKSFQTASYAIEANPTTGDQISFSGGAVGDVPVNIETSKQREVITGGAFTDLDFSNGGADDGTIEFDIEVNGAAAVGITLEAADFADPTEVTAAELAEVLNEKFTAGSVAATASVNADGELVITGATTGDGDAAIEISNYTATDIDAGASGLADGTGTPEQVAKTVDELVDEINDNPLLEGRIRASNDNGKLRIENQSTQELEVSGANSTGITGLAAASSTIDGNSVRAGLADQFNELRDQLDKLADDASFNGINLLRGDKLTITFNETGTSSIDIQTDDGETVNARNLGVPTQLQEEQLDSDVTIDGLLTDLKAALDEVRSQASTFGSNLSIVQNRQTFTQSMINTLESGAGNLTLADMNTEAANLLALQTRQQLSQNSLSLASQADQSILQLLQ
jgi:flagellin